MRYNFLSFLALALLLGTTSAQAGPLVYQPVNPSFGGDSFNGSYLMSNASAQNDHERPKNPSDSLENFERTITSSLLNRISFQIADQIFGENAAESGQFQVGDSILSFQRSGDNVDITIFDGVTGNSTVITVPAPQLAAQ